MIKQKLIYDKSKSNQFQLIVRDETGLFNPSNKAGYGGENGNRPDLIEKYFFNIFNMNTGERYLQIQSDDLTNNSEIHNPPLSAILNKENIYINSDNFDKNNFSDGVYKITMNIQINTLYYGEGFAGTDMIVNVPGAKLLFENYKSIIVDNEIYDINSYEDSTLILNTTIKNNFSEFKPSLKTSVVFILYDRLEDCLSKRISSFIKDCSCNKVKDINGLTELQILDWGIKKCIDKEDYLQAKDYLDLMYKFCSSLKCNC